jgi:predicted O-methyltransferase YrrM
MNHGHRSIAESLGRPPGLFRMVDGIMGGEGPRLRAIRAESARQGLPSIAIGPEEGKILEFFVKALGIRRAVEIGTLGGYSAAWIARALPRNGILDTLEISPVHAAVARASLRRAGLLKKVVIHEGPALQVLPGLSKLGPYDFCFIDADKANYAKYLAWAVKNVRPGGLVVGDNAYLFGKLHLSPAAAGEDAAGVTAMRRFLKMLSDPRYFAASAMIPTPEGMAVGWRR